jgi:anti-anti-sigma factor
MYDNGRETPGASAAATPDESCTMTIDQEQNLITFRIAGIIDARAQQLFKDLFNKVEPPGVQFDFAGVKRINSMGIALLLRCFKQIRDNKKAEIRLLNLNQVNRMLFKITGVFLLAVPEEESKGYLQ